MQPIVQPIIWQTNRWIHRWIHCKKAFLVLISLYGSLTQALVMEDLVRDGALASTLSHQKIGYYIGSFDPLHRGHEAVVRRVLEQHWCDYVLIYPAWGGDGYKKRTDVSIRLEMLFAAFADHPNVIVTKLDPGSLQDTLMEPTTDEIAGKPSVKTRLLGTEYIGIIGSDTAFETSKDDKKLSVFMRGIAIPEPYKQHTIGGIIAIPVQRFIISLRGEDSIDSFNGFFGHRPIMGIIPADYLDLSSTKVRTWIKDGRTLEEDWVSPGVKAIMESYDLYHD